MNPTLSPKQKKPLTTIEEICKLIESSIKSLSGKVVTVTSEIELNYKYNFIINYLGKTIHFSSMNYCIDPNQINENKLIGFKQYFSLNMTLVIPKLEEWELEHKANQLISKHPLFSGL